ncbi:MAG: trimethylamine methyltransferase [Deltaproteobacteria bacterium]|jgi:trimethylamine--corrinoid protein Co-methyltransferase|nr:trimethylamine methyltransferase [Deltaproteobacteria bacterium]MBT4068244.1 trimethylamine methyltransferase [Candidatus Neomarinimicrobiota bacterium]MBT5177099.1 trimethylamine methyltransferase [Candidatus Neomarinimicrobiota bacterium]
MVNIVKENRLRPTRSGGRAARKAQRSAESQNQVVKAGMLGGTYKPLQDRDLEKIHQAALKILETVGIGDATPEVIELATDHGCILNEGRLCFPQALIEDVLANAANEYVVHSRSPTHADLHVGGYRVHYATSGEAVTIFEYDSKTYRPSTLVDLYDACRLVDKLEYIHQFGQTVIPTEISDLDEHDFNVAYALLSGTEKPFEMTFNRVQNIRPTIEMFDMVLGGPGRFAEKPFCTFGGCPIVSPLRFAKDNLDVLVETSRLGLINDIAIAPQAGATAPAPLAGTLAQVTAEGLACLAIVNFIRPGCPMSFAIWPFISDLRTGSFSGGSGEEAVIIAAAVQIGKFYNLPTTVPSCMTDSKIPDAQAGYEKGITAVLAGLAGGNRILESAGMLGSLMGCSFEALVLDNDMLGMVQRVIRGIEVTDETLSVDVIKEVALGPGHYLGHAQTLELMQSEFLYPKLADRAAPGIWEQEGSKDILERAHEVAGEILAVHYPNHLDPKIDESIRNRFPILLPRDAMKQNYRWAAP